MVLVGGFGVPGALLGPLARQLRGEGHEVSVAPLGLNVDCGERAAARLEAHLDGPAALVGHSRGGLLAKVVAVRRPDLVERLVTVATPWLVGPPSPAAERIGRAIRLPSAGCGTGPCCERLRHDVEQDPAVPWTALWSSADRVAGDLGRPPPAATAVDTGTTHVGAVLSAAGRAAIAEALR